MKTGVSNYISYLSKQDEKKIKTALKTLSVNDAERVIAFLEVTLDCANFSSRHIGEDGLVSDEISVSEYVNNGLNKNDVVFAMDWLVKNTPVRRLQPFPQRFTNRHTNKIEVVISFNDLDYAKQLLPIIRTEQKDMVNKLSFLNKKLYIRGFCVSICKQSGTQECWLMHTIFSNPVKQWHNDELIEATGNKETIKQRAGLTTDEELKDHKTKKYYHLAKKINDKVARETNIKDFLKITTKYIQINPKYLG